MFISRERWLMFYGIRSSWNICWEKNSFLVCYSILRETSKSCQKYLPQSFTFWTGILTMLILRKRTKRFHLFLLWRKWFGCFLRVRTVMAKSVIYNFDTLIGFNRFFWEYCYHLHLWFHLVEPHDPRRDITTQKISEVDSTTFQERIKTL